MQQGTPGRDYAKWLNEQPEGSDEEIDAEIALPIAFEDAIGNAAHVQSANARQGVAALG